jgi:MoaA/NifB/PqqE/SkfB family radical SAM enzyme
MCHIWKYPTQPEAEISPRDLERLPPMFFTNVGGGEPFLRDDLVEIVEVLRGRSRRIVISTNGSLTGRILALCRKYPDVGIRISLDGLPRTHDAIRGMPGGFERAFCSLLALKRMGKTDIGLAMTLQDCNAT